MRLHVCLRIVIAVLVFGVFPSIGQAQNKKSSRSIKPVPDLSPSTLPDQIQESSREAVRPQRVERDQTEEAPPLVRAAEFLPPELLKGKDWRVAAEGAWKQGRLEWVLLTSHGQITARGLPMLELRISEVEAIDRLLPLVDEPLLVNGMMQSLVDTTKGVGIIATDPLGSVGRFPKGVNMMVRSQFDQADRKAGPPLRRRLANAVGCDPETNNAILDQYLDYVSKRKLVGKGLARLGMMAAPVPGLSLLSLTTDIKKMVLDQPPHAINRENETVLAVDKAVGSAAREFCRNPAWTTSQRLLLLEYYKSLKDVRNRSKLIEWAAQARDEADALDTIYRAKMLADLHQQWPIRQIDSASFPVAFLEDGRAVAILSDDLNYDSQAFQRKLADTRQVIGQVDALLMASGGLTTRAVERVRQTGFALIERESPKTDSSTIPEKVQP